MAELLVSFEEPVSHATGRYAARAVGRQGDDGMWEGWLEFEPLDTAGAIVVGPVETTQPEPEHVRYWATGLTPVFLQGALGRALNPLIVSVRAQEEAVSDAPAPRLQRVPVERPTADAILDPFEVGSRSLDILRQELTALNRPRLTNIIAAYDLNPAGDDVDWMSDVQLIQFIVTATEVQMNRGGRGR
jgi:hypothetical protein